MSGLYVHIPFCARRCPYCDFAVHVGAGTGFVADYLNALQDELLAQLRFHRGTIRTIFFGGGTPTMLSSQALAGLLQLVKDNAHVLSDAEISIEANPEDLNETQLASLREVGFNRISMGAQSFDDLALRKLGRRHTHTHIEYSFRACRRAGFSNISLDLMYGLPDQSRASWQETLMRALELEPEHLSCYSLTIEANTPFARRVQEGSLIPLDDGAQADLMQDAVDATQSAGLSRYETSNYARVGAESRHNMNYWRGGDYLAAGCGAHGHQAGHRWWNERDASKYVSRMKADQSAREGEEFLTPLQRLTEIVMLGLRLREGFDLDEVSRRLEVNAYRVLNAGLRDLEAQKMLRLDGSVVCLEPQWASVADAVAAKLVAKL